MTALVFFAAGTFKDVGSSWPWSFSILRKVSFPLKGFSPFLFFYVDFFLSGGRALSSLILPSQFF